MDYSSFKWGATTYPLPASGSGIGGAGASLLRDADAPLFYVLDYYASILNRHLSTRFLAEASAAGAQQISSIVAGVLPLDPTPFLTEQHIGFPLLAAYRKETRFENIGGRKHSVDELEVAYVLPPLQAGEAENLMPILKAVVSVLDNRTEQGMDPGYLSGAHVWRTAGVAGAEVKSAVYGAYAPPSEDVFPAVVLKLELKEVSDYAVTEFDSFAGGNLNIDLKDPSQETVVTDFVEVDTQPAPTLTVASPNNGSKVGGTIVTLTGTNFVVGTTPIIWFGNVEATNVVVLTTTSVQCRTPAHDAFPTFIADVVMENADGQEATLTAGFTFTSP